MSDEFTCVECGMTWLSQEDADNCCNEEECCGQCGETADFCVCCSECECYPCECGDPCPNCGYHVDPDTGECGNCGHVNGVDPDEAAVALKFGIKVDRDIAQHVADYYLLEHLWRIEGSDRAGKVLREMANNLAPEFATYLDLAIGGEIRHAHYNVVENAGFTIAPGHGDDRGGAWLEWAEWKTPKERCKYAQGLFYLGWSKTPDGGYDPSPFKNRAFSSSFGGPAWGQIADTLNLYLTKKVSRVGFLDRVWNLQHNGGIALNKMYRQAMSDPNAIRKVLDAHGNSEYEVLLDKASPEVIELWNCMAFAQSAGMTEYLKAINESVYNPGGVTALQFNTTTDNDAITRWKRHQRYVGKMRGQLKWQSHFTSE